jgi:hypothetical protein
VRLPSCQLIAGQEKTFRKVRLRLTLLDQLTAFKWLNSKLESADLKPMNNLGTDLSDGVKLVQLVVRCCPPAHLR